MIVGRVNQRIVADRLAWIERMVGRVRALPLGSKEEFLAHERIEDILHLAETLRRWLVERAECLDRICVKIRTAKKG